MSKEIIDNLLQELRRGTLVLSVLSQLAKPTYGYLLLQSLEQKGLEIEAGTLYPLLRRLEKQELLHSEWETSGTKPRKYYELSSIGHEVFKQLCIEWDSIVNSTNILIKDGGNKDA